MKAAAARHGTSAWSPNPPTLLPWYPLQLRFVQCPLLCLLHTLATGYPRPNRRGPRCQAARHRDKRKKGDEGTDDDGPCFAPNNDVFLVSRLMCLP